MKRLSKLFFIVFVACACSTIAKATDLPNFYRSTFIQGIPKKDVDDWNTFFDARYSAGSTKKGFDGQQNSTDILNIYGLVNFNRMGYNIGLSQETLANTPTPTTYTWLREGGNIPNYGFTGNNGKIELHGKAKIREFDFEWQQNIVNGFFAKVYVPIRTVKINDISYTDQTMSTTTNYSDFQTFLDTYFADVLTENDYLPLTTVFDKTYISDISVSVGWQAYAKNALYLLGDLYGYALLSVIIPTAPKQPLNRVVSLPLGYDNHIGFNTEFSINVRPKQWISLGFHAEFMAFISQQKQKRLVTDTSQSGLIILEKGQVKEDPGSLWGVGINLEVTPLVKGLFLRAGYSFTRRESTNLTVKDDNYLSALIAAEIAADTIYKTSTAVMANSDNRLKAWNQHVAHFQLGFDAREQTNSLLAPKFVFSYDWQFLGRNTWKANMLGGTLGLSINWDF
jgi:hypothetical protein